MPAKRLSKRANGMISAVRSVYIPKPDRFEFNDFFQQVFGAFLFSAPFSVTEEVWGLANSLTPEKMIILVGFTFILSAVIFYYTKLQNVARENINLYISIPKRLVVLWIVSYSATFFILWMFGVIGQISDPFHITKLVILIGFFASMGAAAIDILK